MGCGLGRDRLADRRAVESCDVLLAVIGDQWLTITDQRGRRRLDFRSRRGRPTRTRVLAGVGVAVALVVVAGVVLANLRTTPKGGRIEVNSAPATSGDIRLSGLKADPVQLDSTFAGARNAAREHKDSRKSNQSRTLAPGETIDAQEQVPLDSAGTWKLWPC